MTITSDTIASLDATTIYKVSHIIGEDLFFKHESDADTYINKFPEDIRPYKIKVRLLSQDEQTVLDKLVLENSNYRQALRLIAELESVPRTLINDILSDLGDLPRHIDHIEIDDIITKYRSKVDGYV